MKLKEEIDIMSVHIPVLLYMHNPYIANDNEHMWNGYSHKIPESWLEHEVIYISLITWQRRKTLYIVIKA